MTVLNTLIPQQAVETLGWTLIHFAWQGLALAILLAVALRLLRKASANLRYVVGWSALVLMVMLPIATVLLTLRPAEPGHAIHRDGNTIAAAAESLVLGSTTILFGVDAEPGAIAGNTALSAPDWTQRITSALESALPPIVLGWLLGVFGLSMWRLCGWAQLQILKRRTVTPLGPRWQEMLVNLAGRLHLRRTVRALQSAMIDVPMVIGSIRPIILIPASVLTGSTPQQLEAILLHELAHIRRYDYLANLIQVAIETLGFFHPAVWWVSRTIHIERENCCDDVAAAALQNKVRYARALAWLEETRTQQARLAVAATGSNLLHRISRLVGTSPNEANRYGWIAILAAILLFAPLALSAAHGAELNLRPIKVRPEPLSRLNPKLRWMTRDRIRAIWIGDDLFDKSIEGDRTKAQVIADAGFNVVMVGMGPNTDDTPSGVVDTSKPLALKHDRSKSTALETRLAPNIAEAHRVGLHFFVNWKYGTHHLEPYRKYRSPTKGVAKYTCCPIDETYIAGQHVGKWAVKIAEGGADGINIDTEMYHSDTAEYPDPCVCDDCFATYLKRYATNWKAVYDSVAADERGKWLVDRGALDNLINPWWGDSHYVMFAAKRIEKLWDGVRRRCQAVNPTFVLARYGVFGRLPGMERGLGTPSVPCPMFAGSEYPHGPYRGSFLSKKQIVVGMPMLYVCGTYIKAQPPEMVAKSALQASLYTDGWWAWYGTSLLQDDLPGDYGRAANTSRSDYLDRIKAVHAEIDRILASPKDQWPEREDGKLNWLKKRVAEAKDDKARAEIQAVLTRYMGYVRQGGY